MALTDAQLLAQASVIKTETVAGANTANRVGLMLEDIVDNKINDDKIDVDGTLAADSDLFVASQKATKTYVDALGTTVNASIALKENAANKSNAPLINSALLFPTSGAAKSYIDTADALKEDVVNKSLTQSDFITNGLSATKYPSNVAVKGYIDSTTAGLLRDEGNFTPSATSPGNLYPTVGSGPAGAVAQGDTYFIDTNGFFGTDPVTVGASIRALIAAPASPSDWSVLDASIGIVPEDSANKSNDGTFNAGTPSSVEFPTQFAVATYIAANPVASNLQSVLAAGRTLNNGRNFQGDNSGAGQSGFDVNGFGNAAAFGNTGDNVNAFGVDAGYNNTNDNVNALGAAAAQGNTGTNVNAFGINAGIGNGYNNVNIFGQYSYASGNDQLAFSNGALFNAQISNTNLTDDRKFELPNQSGTIALLSDINTTVQSTVVTLDNAAIISGTSIQILPAPGAGFFIDVISVKSIFTPGGTPLTTPFAYGIIQYGSAGFLNITGQPLTINNTNWFAQYPVIQNIAQQLPFMENASINLLLSTPMSGGVGNQIKFYITYQIVAI